MNTADEVHWGYSLGGASAGLMWIPDDAANKSLRCQICNTYPDAFITSLDTRP